MQPTTDETPPLTKAQRDELDRRLSRLVEDRPQNLTWEQVKAELQRRGRNPLD